MATNKDFLKASKNAKHAIAKKMKGEKPYPVRPQMKHQSPDFFKA